MKWEDAFKKQDRIIICYIDATSLPLNCHLNVLHGGEESQMPLPDHSQLIILLLERQFKELFDILCERLRPQVLIRIAECNLSEST